MTSHFRGSLVRRRLVLVVIGLLAGASAPLSSASAYTHKILYSFCAKANCADGSTPHGGLTMDSTGALFGTTGGGGAHNAGTVFKLTPNSKKTKWKLETLYSFCPKGDSCADGKSPNGALVIDTAGNLYGTTGSGGATNSGTVFKLSPVAGQSKWKGTRLHDFISGGSDGTTPTAGLTYEGARSGALYDGVSPLYGTTLGGGGGDATGTVFSVTPVAGKAQWKEKILHAFVFSEGTVLIGGVIFDNLGNLYGTAVTSGSSTFAGTIFELSPNAQRTRWETTVLYNFCANFVCTDGANPTATLAMDPSGKLFGTTAMGGNGNNGVVYSLVPDGVNSQTETLYDFCSQQNCADGRDPGDGSVGPLAIDASGNLFGTTRYGGNGGSNGFGVAYELNGATQTVLYSFCAEANCADGWFPSSGLLLDGSNNLIGTTDNGGAHAGGTIYELTP